MRLSPAHAYATLLKHSSLSLSATLFTGQQFSAQCTRGPVPFGVAAAVGTVGLA